MNLINLSELSKTSRTGRVPNPVPVPTPTVQRMHGALPVIRVFNDRTFNESLFQEVSEKLLHYDPVTSTDLSRMGVDMLNFSHAEHKAVVDHMLDRAEHTQGGHAWARTMDGLLTDGIEEINPSITALGAWTVNCDSASFSSKLSTLLVDKLADTYLHDAKKLVLDVPNPIAKISAGAFIPHTDTHMVEQILPKIINRAGNQYQNNELATALIIASAVYTKATEEDIAKLLDVANSNPKFTGHIADSVVYSQLQQNIPYEKQYAFETHQPDID